MPSTPKSETTRSARKAKPLLQLLSTIAGIALFGALCYYAGLYVSAEKRMHTVCAKFTPGLSLGSATSVAEAHGMTAPKNAPTTYVVETATFGRYGCKLEFKDGVLEKSTYNFQD